jgi:hypothetical protein
MNTFKGADSSAWKERVLNMRCSSSYKMLRSPSMNFTSNWTTKNSQAWMTLGGTLDVPGEWSWMHQEEKNLPNPEGWTWPLKPSPYVRSKLSDPILNTTNWFAHLSCDDDRPATTSESKQLYPGYSDDQRDHQTPPVTEQTCSQILDHNSL